MQMRGGLLIEPWKAYRFYTNAEVTDFSPVVTLTNANLTSVTGYVNPLLQHAFQHILNT